MDKIGKLSRRIQMASRLFLTIMVKKMTKICYHSTKFQIIQNILIINFNNNKCKICWISNNLTTKITNQSTNMSIKKLINQLRIASINIKSSHQIQSLMIIHSESLIIMQKNKFKINTIKTQLKQQIRSLNVKLLRKETITTRIYQI